MLNEIKENDRIKQAMARVHNYKGYIVPLARTYIDIGQWLLVKSSILDTSHLIDNLIVIMGRKI